MTRFRANRDGLAVAATLTRILAGVCSLGCKLRHQRGDRDTPHERWGMGGGAAIQKQVRAARSAQGRPGAQGS